LKLRLFRFIWIANVVSNIGTWMHDVGAGWLMTSLTNSPVMVALIQTATTLPVFILAVPAGALADILDRRHYLITALIWMMSIAGILGVLTLIGVTNDWVLLAMTFALAIGTAMMLPAMSAVTPEIVPRHELHSALSLNAMGMNISRAIGPAIAGVIIAVAGSGAVFLINSITFLFVIVVLVRWQRNIQLSSLPAERLVTAIKTGVRFAMNAPQLQVAMIRGVGYFMFATVLWALLPLVAKNLIGGGPQTFGLLVASIGIGAVLGALSLPKLRMRFTSDQLVSGSTLLFAMALFAISSLHSMALMLLATAMFGAAHIAVFSSSLLAAQLALPNWVRSRGMSIYLAVFMGSMAGGSVVWGYIAKHYGISTALNIAAAGSLITGYFIRRWHIDDNENIDMSPSMHWEAPVTHYEISHDRSPVMVIVHYYVDRDNLAEFNRLIRQLGNSRRRDGAYAWDIMEDVREPNHFIEYYIVESWLGHLRQHERATNTDRLIQEEIRKLLIDKQPPKVTHFVGPRHQS
jgi:MFS family permease